MVQIISTIASVANFQLTEAGFVGEEQHAVMLGNKFLCQASRPNIMRQLTVLPGGEPQPLERAMRVIPTIYARSRFDHHAYPIGILPLCNATYSGRRAKRKIHHPAYKGYQSTTRADGLVVACKGIRPPQFPRQWEQPCNNYSAFSPNFHVVPLRT
ncbi:hypothetical protein B0J17DRAFT_626409 [Rhizoctonia solani]|nr:hypothetical protein B0J17DRAFT_626409 [Rhizoctonia solani]